MIHLEFKNSELTITWRMLVLLFCVALGIHLGGVVSGYCIAQAQFAQRAEARDKAIAQLPDKTADKVKQAVEDDDK